MAEPNAELMCWIDTETTGKHADRGLLLEVAMIITDTDLNVIASKQQVILHSRDVEWDCSDDFVRNMHTNNGLFDEISLGTPLQTAERQFIAFVDGIVSCYGGGLPVVAGNSVGFDRKWLEQHMPALNETHLHYRNIDVSTIKELARMRAPEVLATAPQKSLGHRGLPDLHESIAELRHYLDNGLF